MELHSNLADQLAPFLCQHQLRQIAANANRVSPLEERLFGAVLFLDIAGFSELTERYATRSGEGAEHLSSLLDDYFGKIASHIATHGGDIIAFAGDAALALWSTSLLDNLAQLAGEAAQTAMEIQGEVRSPTAGGSGLVQRIGIGVGDVSLLQLGGQDGKWAFLVAGEAVREAGRANQAAGLGEVALSAETWRLIESRASGMKLISGEVRLARISLPPHAPSLQSHAAVEIPVDVLSRCVPRIVSERLVAGQADWLSEFRALTVLFIKLDSVESGDASAFGHLNRAVEATQKKLAQFEGSLYQFLMDDKGLVLLAVFGFPPLAHEDDAARGMRAALAIQADLAADDLPTSIGIATGRAFCGIYGAKFRRQYSAVGPVMNLAARLMQAASGGILVDEATRRSAAAIGMVFDPPRQLRLKGIDQPMAAYSPSGVRPRIVDRKDEQSALGTAVKQLAREHRSTAIVLEGEPGIGKSELFELLQQLAGETRIACFRGTGDAVAYSTPYHIWRGVFRTLFRLETLPDDPAMQRRHVLERLTGNAEFQSLAPLLSDVLPLQIPENELTAQMSGQVRAENTRRLLAGLLQEFAHGDPIILMLEDAHWADSASWALVWLVAQSVKPTLMAVSLRPHGADAPPEYHQLLGSSNTAHFQLRLLHESEIEELLRRRLNVESLPAAVTEFIYRKSGGQPLFAEQLTYALRDAGLIRISGAVCVVNLAIGQDLESALESMRIPRTVEGVVTARLDRLDPAQQMALKIASVIGFNFSLTTLRDVYPLPAEREHLPAILLELERLDLIRRSASGVDEYEFQHAVSQDVVYEAVAFGKRRELHQAIAEWHEARNSENRESLAPLLAHHWEQAGHPARAMAYAGQAGESALRSFANQEAVRFLKRALEFDQQIDSQTGSSEAWRLVQRARWEILLGRASVNLSRHNDGREHLTRGLELYGERPSTSKAGFVFGLLGQVLRQVTHRLRPLRVPPVARATALRECAGAYEGLAEIFYLHNEPLGSLFCALKSLNLAEKAGPTPERVRGYASLGALSGFIPLRSPAEAYFRMARETAERVQDLPALAWVQLAMGVYDVGIGNWKRASAEVNRGLEIVQRLGDSRRIDDFRQVLACVLFHTGDVAGSLALLEDARKTAADRGDGRAEGEVVRWKAYGLLLLGRSEELRGCLDELHRLRTLPGLTGEAMHLSDVFALRSVWQWRRGHDAEAYDAAQEGVRRLAPVQNTFHDLVMERTAVAEVFLGLWEKNILTHGSAAVAAVGALREAASKACRELNRFSRIFPIGKPHALIAAGQFENLSGRGRKAELCWRQALAESQRLGLLRAEGLACYQLARHAEKISPERRTWLERARAIFTQMGTPYELAATENELDSLVAARGHS